MPKSILSDRPSTVDIETRSSTITRMQFTLGVNRGVGTVVQYNLSTTEGQLQLR
jgi:hypothetical protein